MIARLAAASPVGQKLAFNLVLLAAMWLFLALTTERFLTGANLTNLFNQVADVAIVATAMTLLMVALNFDLSVGGVVALTGCVAASLVNDGWPIWIAFLAAILLGGAVGATNGFLVLVVGINSVIATLGMMYLTQGAALLSTNGVSFFVPDPSYKTVGAGYLGSIPIPILIMAGVLIVAAVVSRRTLVGKYARAVGSNLQSAQLAGVPTRAVRLALFVLVGLAAGWAGVMVSSRTGGGYPTVGVGFELQVIAAVVLGGTSLFGGEGSVLGTFLGVTIIGSLYNGLDLLQVTTFWQTVALGVVLLVAVGIDAAISRRHQTPRRVRRRETGQLALEKATSALAQRAAANAVEETPLLRMTDVSKSFGGVHALTEASLEVRAGEVHALLGENGAGKSTLVKIVAGALDADQGRFWWRGEEVELKGARQSEELGIHVIFQHPNVLDHLTVAENITLGREQSNLTFIDAQEQRRRSYELLSMLGVELPADVLAGNLRVAEKQIIEIARALWGDVRLLIMDEPTASLGDQETERLFTIVRQLCDRGVGVVFISHKLDEVFAIADRITVLRNGQTVGTVEREATNPEDLIAMMVGRRLAAVSEKESHVGERIVLSVESLTTDTGLADISFDLREGEVLGVYGLLGSGRTELTRALFGADRISQGRIMVNGKPVKLRSPADAKRSGVGLVPEERSRASFAFLTVRENITAASIKMISKRGWLQRRRERKLSQEIVDALDIRPPSIDALVHSLSGGNQQKVVVGRWLLRDVPILVMDDPTSGIDVGAKDDLYRLIGDMTSRGTAVIMTSSELPELLALADRIMVLHRGRLAGILNKGEITREAVIAMAVGAGPGADSGRPRQVDARSAEMTEA